MTEPKRAELYTGRAIIAQIKHVIDLAKQQDGYERANGFAFEPTFKIRVGGVEGLPRSGVYYVKNADHGMVSHTINTGFSEADFNAVAHVLEREAGFGVVVETNTADGCRNLTFGNGLSMNFIPFRQSGVSITVPDALLPSLQQFQQAGRIPG